MRAAVFATAVCLPASWAAAQDRPSLGEALLSLEGDALYGEYLAAECLSCHPKDDSYDGIPPIVHLDEEAFRLAMLDYQTGFREHQVMNMIASRLGDEEVAALSAYFAELGKELGYNE